jgi:PAS domain S-box-containing protein
MSQDSIAPVDRVQEAARILLVTDGYMDAEVWRAALGPGVALSVAATAEALGAALSDSSPPGLILLEFSPYLSAGSLLHQSILNHPRSRHVPVVVVVSAHEEGAELRALQAGACEVLTSPVSFAVARWRIERHLNRGPAAAPAAVEAMAEPASFELAHLPPAFMEMLRDYPDGLLIETPDGQVVACSQAFLDQWSLSAHELREWGSAGLRAHMVAQLSQTCLDQLPEGQKPEQLLQGADGDLLTRQGQWLRRLYLLAQLPSLATLQVECWRDVSETHLLQDRAVEQFKRTLLHSQLPYQIYFKDTASRFTRINDTLAKRLGLQHPEQAIGLSDADFYAPEHAEQTRREESALMRSGQALVGMLHLEPWKGGDQKWNLSSKVPLLDVEGRVVGVFGISHDVSVDKQRQQAVRDLESFTANVEHDLRAPLRSVDGYSQILLSQYASMLDNNAQDYLKRLRAAATGMNRLLLDMGRLARIGQQTLRRSQVDVTVLAHKVVGQLRDLRPDRHFEVTIAPDLVAHADAGLLELALTNLINNAWKFSAKAQAPHIDVGCELVQGESRWFVRDNGAGFDAAQIERLFGAFQRAHSNREFPGSGVGLAIVKRVVDKHAGRIWAHSEVGRGAVFYFTLQPSPPQG